MPDLEAHTQDALINWIGQTAKHGQTIGITPRRYEAPKYNEAGTVLNPLTLPAIVVNALITGRLHANLNVYHLECTIDLVMQADDTTQSVWDEKSGQLETVLQVDNLAEELTAAGDHFRCHGIVSRFPLGKQTENRHWRRRFQVNLWAAELR